MIMNIFQKPRILGLPLILFGFAMIFMTVIKIKAVALLFSIAALLLSIVSLTQEYKLLEKNSRPQSKKEIKKTE